uniref:hypothetical protein n=1 Tax=Selenomonas sp. AB3002 TaxID=1392502 RepID=UPI001C82A64F
ESCMINFDDRIEKIPLIGGNTVQDYGHISSGDSITVSACFSWDNAAAIYSLWESRTLVNFTDESGQFGKMCDLFCALINISHGLKIMCYSTLRFGGFKNVKRLY